MLCLTLLLCGWHLQMNIAIYKQPQLIWNRLHEKHALLYLSSAFTGNQSLIILTFSAYASIIVFGNRFFYCFVEISSVSLLSKLLAFLGYLSVHLSNSRRFHSLRPELIFFSVACYCVSLIGFSNTLWDWACLPATPCACEFNPWGIGFHVGSVGVRARLLVG